MILPVAPIGAATVAESVEHTPNKQDPVIQTRAFQINESPINPAFLEYRRQKSIELFSTQSKEVTGYIPSPLDLSHTKDTKPGIDWMAQIEAKGMTYDLRNEGKVSPVKDQGSEGSCWAFATLASLESYLLPGEEWDFSENNMKNLLKPIYPEGFDYDDGGNQKMATAYLARLSGPVLESDDPYQAGQTYSPQDLPPLKHLNSVFFLPHRNGDLDVDTIKEALIEYGALFAAMSYKNTAYNPATTAFYTKYSAGLNHAITIVGWNDTYDSKNFLTRPPGDGAFIVKNSWGEDWGDAGYFYISYYDANLDQVVAFTATNCTGYDRIYQYDPLGWVRNTGYNGDNGWFANLFTATEEEMLQAVSFYTPVIDTEYQITIYQNPVDGPIEGGMALATSTGRIDLPGYHTIDLAPVHLYQGDHISIVINLTTPGYTFPIPIERPIDGYSSKARAGPGESYISPDGINWSDLTSEIDNANVCIKAFTTVLTSPESAFSANQTSGEAPLPVRFTDASRGTPTSWYWDFGDGGVSRVQNPTYSYTHPGEYTVHLKTVNSQGTNSNLKAEYISVTEPEPLEALFTTQPTCGPAPLKVQFNDQSTGSPIVWLWHFGDGTNSTEQHPEKTYTHPGSYSVSLMVSSIAGNNSRTETDYINVYLRADFNRNGRIDIGDVSKVGWMAAGLVEEDLEADFDGDGHVTGADAARIAYYYVGKIQEL